MTKEKMKFQYRYLRIPKGDPREAEIHKEGDGVQAIDMPAFTEAHPGCLVGRIGSEHGGQYTFEWYQPREGDVLEVSQDFRGPKALEQAIEAAVLDPELFFDMELV